VVGLVCVVFKKRHASSGHFGVFCGLAGLWSAYIYIVESVYSLLLPFIQYPHLIFHIGLYLCICIVVLSFPGFFFLLLIHMHYPLVVCSVFYRSTLDEWDFASTLREPSSPTHISLPS